MIIFVGHSGTGKDTALRVMKDLGYNTITSWTTRPPRHYEKDGVDYYFITETQFKKLNELGVFAETANYNGWHYGMAKGDCKNNAVVIVEPIGLKQLKELWEKGEIDLIVVYFKVNSDVKKQRLIDRGDDLQEIERRIKDDESREDFKKVEETADFIIENNGSLEELEKKVIMLAKWIDKM